MRIRISKHNSELIDQLTNLYNFKYDGIIARIAFCLSLQLNKKFNISEDLQISSDGKDWRDERALFGVSADDKSYYVIYKAMLDQQYKQNLLEDDFIKLFKHHLNYGLVKIHSDIKDKDITSGFHISYLMKIVKNGLDLINETNPFVSLANHKIEINSIKNLIQFELGKTTTGEPVNIKLNQDYEPQHIAIAGMTRSGKTELVKHILYEINKSSEGKLHYIFFDYKGEGESGKLSEFLLSTNTEFVNLEKTPFTFNPLESIDLNDERSRQMNITSIVDAISSVETKMGTSQKHILKTVLTNCFDNVGKGKIPTVENVFSSLVEYYTENDIKPDTLYAIIENLSGVIFKEPIDYNQKIYNKNLYLNLPTRASDTLRQICVYLTLNYLFSEFMKCEPVVQNEYKIKPMRYVIVIDEAHVYLKSKSSRKILEDLLRLVSSKGVAVILLSQGVEDYKHKDFDFTSQVKISICLNIMNKDYNLIKNFVGTPKSEPKLRDVIDKLQSGRAVINLYEPQLIEINQFWKTISKN